MAERVIRTHGNWKRPRSSQILWCHSSIRGLEMADLCPDCGLDRELVGRVHRCIPRPVMYEFFVNMYSKYVRFASWFIKLRKFLIYTPREEFVKEAMEYIAITRLEGDYLEFGVFRGHTFVAAYHFAQRNNLS